MNKKLKGGSVLEGVLVLAGLIIILALFALPKTPGGSSPSFNSIFKNTGPSYTSSNESSAGVKKTSYYANSISIDSGNASYEYQPSLEYVSIENNSGNPVDVTGWTLQNGKGQRTFAVGDMEKTIPSDTVAIPRAASFVSPSGQNSFQDVVLKNNEQAIINTGTVAVGSPYRIVSFKENRCSGYLDALPEYRGNFNPPLSRSCPNPRNEPGVSGLDLTCQDYINNNLSSCHTPKFQTLDNNGNVCYNCVDGNQSLSGSCVAFIEAHFNYAGCLANHENDANFYLDTWRIFLGRPMELWAASHETISLFDSTGKLVNYNSY